MKPWAFKGELIKSVKEDYVGIKKIAERSGYAFRGRYHDPELNDLYYEDVYYKNCMVAADGSPIKYGKGNSSVLIAGSVGFGPFVSIRVYNKRAYNYIKSELRNKFHFKTEEVDGKWTTLKKGNVVIDICLSAWKIDWQISLSGSVSASLYCTYTVQFMSILGDMGIFSLTKSSERLAYDSNFYLNL